MSANLCDIGRLYCVAGVRKNLVSVTFCGVCAPCCLFPRKPARQVKILGVVKTILKTHWCVPLVTLCSTGYFFLTDIKL